MPAPFADSPIPEYVSESVFEADFIGGPVWRLADPSFARQAIEAAGENGVRLVTCRTNDAEMMGETGFVQVETLVTLKLSDDIAHGFTDAGGSSLSTRLATGADIPACRGIAEQAFQYDRFHSDPNIPNAIADAIKAQWIDNAIKGRANAVYVREDAAGNVAGFVALMLTNDRDVIDLIAVAPAQQGVGCGRALVLAAISHANSHALPLYVGTQSANLASIKFYEKMGFEPVGQQAGWHWHNSQFSLL